MKKNLLIVFFLLIFLEVTAVYAENPRVQCGNGTVTIKMSVPSTNVRCLTVMNSEKAAEGKSLSEARISSAAVVIDDYKVEGKFSPEVAAFSMNGLSNVNSEIYQKAVDLTTMINKINGGEGINAVTAPIPFLPYQDKTQLFVAMPEIINFISGTAIRFITAYGDSGAMVDNGNLLYTVQGISQDGKYYLSITIPISNSQIASPINPAGFDWNSLPPESWKPSLTELDEMAKSVSLQ